MSGTVLGVLLLGALVNGCGSETNSHTVVLSGAKAMQEVEALVAIRPRDAGTSGARRAAEHLETRLKNLGLKTTVDSFSEQTPYGEPVFHNVLARLPGNSDRLILLASHFDTKAGIPGDFQGANDSGSSSGLLLELARVLCARAPYETEFMIAFFDGEECREQYGPRDGLHGSRRLAQQIYEAGGAPKVEAVIVLDMIGDRDLNITVPRNSSSRLVRELFAAAHQAGSRAAFRLGRGSILDDHVPFQLAGMPAIDVIDFEFGSAPGKNDYWHTTNDTLDKLSVDSLQTVGDTVLRMIENLQPE